MNEKYINEIREFIINEFLFGEVGDLKNNLSFIESGIIDSTGILEFIEFLESKYKITIDDEEMIPENLDSINNAIGFIERKMMINENIEQL